MTSLTSFCRYLVRGTTNFFARHNVTSGAIEALEFITTCVFHFFRFLIQCVFMPSSIARCEIFNDYSLLSYDEEEDDDIDQYFGSKRGGRKFAHAYTEADIRRIIIGTRLSEKIEELGYPDWYVEFDLSDCFAHSVYIRSESLPEKDQYIGFLMINPTGNHRRKVSDLDLKLLHVRWLALQNPLGRFTAERLRFPGQKYPGTHCGRKLFEILLSEARKHKKDGILNTPQHFHNAYFYRGFFFVDPKIYGTFLRMVSDLKQDIEKHGIALVSWVIYMGFLRSKEHPFKWEPKDQVYPITWRMWSYFLSPSYIRDTTVAEMNAGPFTVDWIAANSEGILNILATD